MKLQERYVIPWRAAMMAVICLLAGGSLRAQNLDKQNPLLQSPPEQKLDYETFFVIKIDAALPREHALIFDGYSKNVLRRLRNMDYAGRLKPAAGEDDPDAAALAAREGVDEGRVLVFSARYRLRIRRTIEKGDGTTGDYLIRKDRETHILLYAALYDAAERRMVYERREECDPAAYASLLDMIRDDLQALYPDPVIIPKRERVLRAGVGPLALFPLAKYGTIISAAYGASFRAELEGLWAAPVFPLAGIGLLYGVSSNERIDHYAGIPVTAGVGGVLRFGAFSAGASAGGGVLLHMIQAESFRVYADPLCVLEIDLGLRVSPESMLFIRPGIGVFPEARRIGCFASVTAGLMRKL